MCIPLKNINFLKSLVFLGIAFSAMNSEASRGATSSATLVLTGHVPEVMSVTTESIISELALEPGMKLAHPIANLQFRYNNEAAAITISSSTESGQPENEFNKSIFISPIKIGVKGKCGSLDAKALARGIDLDSEGIDIKSNHLPDQLKKTQAGVVESCQLVATFNTETQKRRMRNGVYAMDLVVTMVAL